MRQPDTTRLSRPPPSVPRRDSYSTPEAAEFATSVNRLLGDVITLSSAARHLRASAAAAGVSGVEAPISVALRALDTAAVELEVVARAGAPRGL